MLGLGKGFGAKRAEALLFIIHNSDEHMIAHLEMYANAAMRRHLFAVVPG